MWILALYLIVPMAYAICGALMLLRGSVAAAVVAVLVALVSMVALGVGAVAEPALVIALPLVRSLLVIVAGMFAIAQATQHPRAADRSAPSTDTGGMTPARNARRDKVFRTASAVYLLVGAALVFMYPPTLPDPELRPVSVQVTIWVFAWSLARPAAYVICGALMLLRGSTAAAVFGVLVAFLDVLPIGWNVMDGSPLWALYAVPFLLVVGAGIWGVARVNRSSRSSPA